LLTENKEPLMKLRSCAAITVAIAVPAAAAPTDKPPIAQFWMDVATHSMSIPGMGDMDTGGGMMGGFFGATKMGGGAPGKWLDTALYTRNKPGGTEGSHAIPQAMNMGVSLPLLPVVASSGGRREGEEGPPEKPKGRILFYWGCGETVRSGQPRVLDFAKAGPDEWGKFTVGRFVPDRGAKAVPGRSVWPNERDRQRVPAEASLEGDHTVSGEGVPPGLRFSLREAYDFMPKLRMTTTGGARASVRIGWQPLTLAQGYFLSAMGGRGEEEMIIWSSSEQPDPGWSLMDYVAPAQVKKLVDEKVVLAPSVDSCAIPAGIFADAAGAMVRMIAYGPELNLAYPPRPTNAKQPWEPEWAVRVRVKSTGMTILGMEDRAERRGRRPASDRNAAPRDEGTNPINVIKGIFSR
jgi:hypothetical protein